MIGIARISNLNHDIDIKPHSHDEPHKKRMRELGKEQRMRELVDEQRMMEPVVLSRYCLVTNYWPTLVVTY